MVRGRFLRHAGLGFGGGVSLATTYTAYTSPNNTFTTVKEIMFKVAVDDSAFLGKGALKPYVAIAKEFDAGINRGQADGGLEAGTYMELGVAPGWASDAVSLAFPVKVGLSLSDYYETPTGVGGAFVDNRFGYFSIAGTVTVPVASGSFGSWNVHGGVEFQKYGEGLEFFAGDDSDVIVSGGIGFTY